MENIDEASAVHKKWYSEAHDINSLDDFTAFAERLLGEKRAYEHDYGTVCHAIASVSIAAAWMANRLPGARGGITGFQAGAVMWEFIAHWQSLEGKPLRLIDFSNMLYPQYEPEFSKTISSETWAYLQKEAQQKLQSGNGTTSNDVTAHWQRIANGEIPFGYVAIDR